MINKFYLLDLLEQSKQKNGHRKFFLKKIFIKSVNTCYLLYLFVKKVVNNCYLFVKKKDK